MNKIAFLFPGQGSQYAGMCKDVHLNRPDVRDIFETASHITGLDLARLCFDSSLDELTKTVNLQPAITTVNISYLNVLRTAGLMPDIVAGHSLGEYSALHAAGIVSLTDIFRLVSERGRLMQREAERNPGGMAAIIGLDIAALREVIGDLKGEGVIAVANHNTDKQIVVTGKQTALAALAAKIGSSAKFISLNVSGPWHSPLMAGAIDDFQFFAKDITFHKPLIPMLFNVTADFVYDPAGISAVMSKQICSPVLWYDIIRKMVSLDISVFVEVGPKKVLSGLLKKILPAGNQFQIYQADDLKGLLKIAEQVKK